MSRLCPNCGAEVVRKSKHGPTPTFCLGGVCSKEFHSRELTEGRAIIALVKAWRLSRNRKEDKALGASCLSELTSIADRFNAADREAGRPRITEYVRIQLKTGYTYQDRQHNWGTRSPKALERRELADSEG